LTPKAKRKIWAKQFSATAWRCSLAPNTNASPVTFPKPYHPYSVVHLRRWK
jgi:hypothetical protein